MEDEQEQEEKSFFSTLLSEGFSKAWNNLYEEDEIKEKVPCRVNCNSILYRMLYCDNTKSRDLILDIADQCEEFSLSNQFLSLDEVRSCIL